MTSATANTDLVRGFNMLKPADLDRLLAEHKDFLDHTRSGKRAVLQSCYLGQANLANSLLAEADLTGSVLTGSSLKFADFSHATLYCCEMSRIDGRYANFCHADMRGVTMNGSNLSHARLDGADFRAGRLLASGSNQTVIDRNGSAVGVDFSYCSLIGASFEGTDLKNANFTGAMIVGSRFNNARLGGARFTGAVLTDVNLTCLQVPPEALKDCVLPPSDQAMANRRQLLFCLNSHQNWIESDSRRGTCAVLDGMDLRPVAADIGKYKLTAFSARNAIATGIDFSCTELQGANFEGADLRGASFEGADLRGVRFKGALLHHAKFLGADMRPLQLKSGDILASDVSDTAFSAAQRAEAVFA